MIQVKGYTQKMYMSMYFLLENKKLLTVSLKIKILFPNVQRFYIFMFLSVINNRNINIKFGKISFLHLIFPPTFWNSINVRVYTV